MYEFDSVSDQFTIEDGPGIFGDGGGVMSFNGSENDEIELWFSASPGDITDDNFFNPSPFFDFVSFIGTPHTFVIEDGQGRILMQIDGVQTAGSSASTSTTATSSTTMPPAECGDPTGGVTATGALVLLRVAIGQSLVPNCSAC